MMEFQNERERVAHLLRRFGFGASEAELDFYAAEGVKGAIEKLLNPEKIEEAALVPVTAFQNQNGQVPMPAVQLHWYMRLLVTRRPLVEKMTIFWHDHFATSAAKVTQSPLMYQHVETLREGALGNFGDLLMSVSKDPAMIFWLDNQENQRGKPNENFAREVMELFTLGIGHYTEKDIQEAARAFTGWTFRRRPRRPEMEQTDFRAADYLFNRRAFDDGEKTVLGKTGPFTGEDLLRQFADHPQTARYIAGKLWAYFAYPNPDPKVVERVATAFVRNGLRIKDALRAIMESPEFFSEKATRKIVKCPVDFTVPTMRQLGLGRIVEAAIAQPDDRPLVRTRGVAGAAQQANLAMGMNLMFPPDVAGWEWGQAWITSATMVERISWADRLFGQVPAGTRKAQVGVPLSQLIQIEPEPAAFVTSLISIFDAQLPAAKRATLDKAAHEASGGLVTTSNANKVASRVCRLIFGAPEFQFS